MGYTNSPLVTYTKISPNKTSPRNHAIDTITIHCMAGNLSVETCGNVFAKASRKASSNYGIGTDGRVALYVEEKDRSYATSNSSNDHRAITIEVANDGGEETGWHVSDKAMESLIELITDICKRNNIKKLVWSTNKTDRVNHSNGCNMTVHRDYTEKSCPGDYLYGKHSYIASEVNKRLNLNGWIQSGNNWYWYNNGASVKNAWINSNNKWYHLSSIGVMDKSQWIKNTDGTWSYVDSSGAAVIGWNKLSWNGITSWYYFDEKSVMQTSKWISDKGKDYYVTSDGAMATNAYVQSKSQSIYYWVGDDGAWQQEWNTSYPDFSKYKVVV